MIIIIVMIILMMIIIIITSDFSCTAGSFREAIPPRKITTPGSRLADICGDRRFPL